MKQNGLTEISWQKARLLSNPERLSVSPWVTFYIKESWHLFSMRTPKNFNHYNTSFMRSRVDAIIATVDDLRTEVELVPLHDLKPEK